MMSGRELMNQIRDINEQIRYLNLHFKTGVETRGAFPKSIVS